MKVKTSITLSGELLDLIDRHIDEFHSRSEFLERAGREFLARRARAETDRRDLQIINRRARSLNAETEDVLGYQVRL